jgi:hypothetical protein
MATQPSLGISAEIQSESGRWVVYLVTTYWEPALETPLRHNSQRIADYPTERQAVLAAQWYLRAAQRNQSPPEDS